MPSPLACRVDLRRLVRLAIFLPEQNCSTRPGSQADIQAKEAASRKSTLRE
jgi:hypothetical protein